jgi:hypothetical protein
VELSLFRQVRPLSVSNQIRPQIEEILSRYPNPPRAVSDGRLACAVAHEPAVILCFIAALLWVVIPLTLIPEASIFTLVIGALAVIFAPLLFGVPLLRIFRLSKALRDGVLAEAVILSVGHVPRSRATADAISFGLASGMRRVFAHGTTFDEPFQHDQAISKRLHVGQRMTVLVDPLQPKVLMDVRVEVDALYASPARQMRDPNATGSG